MPRKSGSAIGKNNDGRDLTFSRNYGDTAKFSFIDEEDEVKLEKQNNFSSSSFNTTEGSSNTSFKTSSSAHSLNSNIRNRGYYPYKITEGEGYQEYEPYVPPQKTEETKGNRYVYNMDEDVNKKKKDKKKNNKCCNIM
ncbi:hypothetical protein ACQ4LE_006985 [Meloidogyne hapla]|uniref:Uncharacterized protein n=1 Tax=Meloidogyne hapla TaxID=6305 RepID=A0A1I8BFV3_MELHA